MINIREIDFDKMNGLVPAVIVDFSNEKVLMLGFMNHKALQKTLDTNFVTFYSRTKKRLWTKGETSGNKLLLKEIMTDCDNDSLLIYAEPAGPVCHTGSYSCFGIDAGENRDFLKQLFELVQTRKRLKPEGSYTTELFESGLDRIIQKVGEEAVETIIAAKNNKADTINEVSDLLYHLLVMLSELDINYNEIIENLRARHINKEGSK